MQPKFYIGPRSIVTDDTMQLLAWCREYGREGPYRQNPVQRFAIGIYQIAQGMKWRGAKKNACASPRHESYAAACIHFLVALEELEVDVWEHLPHKLTEVSDDSGFFVWETLMFQISSAQRMISYSVHYKSTNTKWAARFDKDVLSLHTAEAVKILLSFIPSTKRKAALYDAMEELSATNVKR